MDNLGQETKRLFEIDNLLLDINLALEFLNKLNSEINKFKFNEMILPLIFTTIFNEIRSIRNRGEYSFRIPDTFPVLKIDIPDPTPEEQNSSDFKTIFEAIKTWDINIPDKYTGYESATGSHVCIILRALKNLL